MAILEKLGREMWVENFSVNIKLSYLWGMNIRQSILSAVIFLLSAAYSFSQGCSQCRMMTDQGSGLDEGSFGNNMNSGILYLMIIPYLLILFLFRHRIISFFRGLAKK